MKLNPTQISLVAVFVLVLSACNLLNSDIVLSTDPIFSSLTFTKDDSIVGLEKAVFSLTKDVQQSDSTITNVDSLPYKTDISHVIAKFAFHSTSATYVCMTKKTGVGLDTLWLKTTSSDTLDFNRVVSVTNFAADGKIQPKRYLIKVNVHQVKPDQYQWLKINNDIYDNYASAQKAIYFNNQIYLYVNSGVSNYLYVSADGANWAAAPKPLTGLSGQTKVRNIYAFNNKLYLIQDEGTIFTSDDGYSWVKLDYSTKDYRLMNYLFTLNSEAWIIVQSKSDAKYRFAHSSDGATWVTGTELPDKFPIGDFAAVSFYSRTNRPKAVVAGGYDVNGDLLNSVWSTENGSYWVNFGVENTTLGSLAGATIIAYANKLLLFGGMDNDGNPSANNIMESIDEGFSWSVPDSALNTLQQVKNAISPITNKDTIVPDISYPVRSYQSVVTVTKTAPSGLYTNYFIYLIGGRDRTTVYKDAWRGQLNRLSFIRQDD